eukprot:TRINITY_DN4000_c0_g1_i1.p1 TRINITY_DN4000_c0_g1~~TRINITY_DN4000_c0_g1_i1.p1  ORF type:complete len:333 (+),score=66.21 TRINITY_DN4000_c0_g1_i1:105-1001(+)
MSESLIDLLKNTKVKDIPSIRGQKLVVFNSNDLIRDIYQALSDASFQSAPVYDENKGNYIGMIDLRDVVAYALGLQEQNVPISFTADAIINFSQQNPFVTLSEDATATDALHLMCSQKLHRLPIMSGNKISKLLTQMDFVHWLGQNKEKILSPSIKISDARIGGVTGMPHLLLGVRENEPISKAFTLMKTCNVHGVPVFDENGRVCGNISLSDFKDVLKWDLGHLKVSCKDFFGKMKENKMELVSISSDRAINEIFDVFSKKSVHRIYVVNADKKVEDIITLTNVLDYFHDAAFGIHA